LKLWDIYYVFCALLLTPLKHVSINLILIWFEFIFILFILTEYLIN
jgi:hypothetical protein